MTAEPGWFPIALADEIEPATSTGTRLFGQELVVWRDAGGQSHVWEDRCPHRGMRLSFGFVRGDHIACLYHGWQFDQGGRCRYIPAHPRLDVPASITVDRFASIERLGLVWVYSGDTSAPAGAPPGDNAETLAVRSLTIEAPLSREAVLAANPPPLPSGRAAPDLRQGPLLTFRAGDATLHAGLQPVTATTTAVHLAADPGLRDTVRSLSLWGESIRRTAESPMSTEAHA